ncbi:MAG: hypothetical protein QW719_00755 [Candidatus Micrarchaeaceae archaeon]
MVASMLVEVFAFVFFGVGFNPPFGAILQVLVRYIPELVAFRYYWFAVHFVFLFAFSLLFGYSTAIILQKIKRMRYLVGIAVLFLLLLSLYLYMFDYLPISYGIFGIGAHDYVSNSVKLPSHVFNISNYINSESGNFNVALLPLPGFWELSNYYDGIDVYTSLIDKPVFTGGTSAVNEFFSVQSQPMYSIGGYYIDNTNLSGNDIRISNVMGVLGIKYIVVQGSTLHGSLGPYSEPAFNLSVLYNNLNSSYGLSLIKKYGNSSIFENHNYTPLAYASNIENIGNASLGSILYTLENRTINIHDTSVYSAGIDGLYNDSNTINATPIQNFLRPGISFVQNTPTSVTVHVTNATTPYYLVFRETYDPHWAAFYSNGTQVNPRNHIAVNGFANAWYMNKTGNYTITLYYTLQTDAWIAWGVSFAAFFVTVGIGVYGWREMRHAREVK